jgi:PAT family beta-lactamase induction signal transducer AmpG
MPTARDYLSVFTNRRVGVMLLLGFASGLPLALTSGTLQAWLAVEGVDLKTIGLFTLAGLPYTLKFLWAPLMDRFVPPFLGRRRGWLILMQLALIGGIAAIGFSSPAHAPLAVAALAMAVAFLSASQDIAFDAYRADVLHDRERGIGAAVSVLGYRVAMLISGGGALIVADHAGWALSYSLMAALVAIGVVGTLFGPEPELRVAPPRNLREAAVGPIREFLSRKHALWLLALIVLYKFGDAFSGTLTTAFLLRGPGFTLSEVGYANKILGAVSVILGVLFGGAIMVWLRLFRALLLFGILQALSNLGFMWLAIEGNNLPLMAVAVAFENFTGGMGTAAFVALLMALCDHRYTATQYALLSAAASLGRLYLGPAAGVLAESLGWVTFFLLTAIAALPGLFLLIWLRRAIESVNHRSS